MIKKLFLMLLTLISSVCSAQLTQTDMFDFWEDQSTHNYLVSGITFQGAYVCSGDNSLRLSNCSAGSGTVSIQVAVTPLCDTIQLDFLNAWGGPAPVYADAMYAGLIPDTTNCSYISIMIPNASVVSADGFVTLNITDTIFGCSGDLQLSRVNVYSSTVITTGILSDEFRQATVFPNPSAGLFQLSMQNINSIRTLVVMNLYGEVVRSENKYCGQIDLRNQPDGIYFIHIVAERGTITRKVLLRR
jgi:hypothetical protein